MAIDYRHAIGTALSLLLLGAASAHAQPIAGITYTYDLSTPDEDPGGFPVLVRPYTDPGNTADDTVDDSDPSAITSGGRLTDGDPGSTVFSDPVFGCCLFNNGTYAGFRGDPGIGLAPKPKIDIDLGGTFSLSSFTLHYLVEDQPSIYAPQPIPDGAGGNLFDALTVYGSIDGMNFTSLGFSNDFNPLFGLEGDVGSGAAEVRTATIDLTGSSASHLSIDVRTPYTYIFLSEFVVEGSAAGGLTGDYNNDDKVDAADYVVWRKNKDTTNMLPNDPIGGTIDADQYNQWRANFGMMAPGSGAALGSAAVPEPTTLCLFGLGCLLPLVVGRNL